MARKATIQQYPRKSDDCFDETKVVQHRKKISDRDLRAIVVRAIREANIKSSREILEISDDLTEEQVTDKYRRSGKDLFAYFKKYCGDPASTAHQCYKRNYAEVAIEQYRNRTLQKERMNSGWRYQFIAKDAARKTDRFHDISDLALAEADFTVSVSYLEGDGRLTIYVSVKNRSNTMGGQDWPKAITALEAVAIADKNLKGDYLCVFGIAMERGSQVIKRRGQTGQAHSNNTEIWKSDFFWPFFTNLRYEEVMTAVLDVLIQTQKSDVIDLTVPPALVESFGECCKRARLVDDDGNFDNPHKLVQLFCGVKL